MSKKTTNGERENITALHVLEYFVFVYGHKIEGVGTRSWGRLYNPIGERRWCGEVLSSRA